MKTRAPRSLLIDLEDDEFFETQEDSFFFKRYQTGNDNGMIPIEIRQRIWDELLLHDEEDVMVLNHRIREFHFPLKTYLWRDCERIPRTGNQSSHNPNCNRCKRKEPINSVTPVKANECPAENQNSNALINFDPYRITDRYPVGHGGQGLAILKTCKAIYREALPSLYTKRMFITSTIRDLVTAPYDRWNAPAWDHEIIDHLELLVKFLTEIGESGRYLVRNIRLPLAIDDYRIFDLNLNPGFAATQRRKAQALKNIANLLPLKLDNLNIAVQVDYHLSRCVINEAFRDPTQTMPMVEANFFTDTPQEYLDDIITWFTELFPHLHENWRLGDNWWRQKITLRYRVMNVFNIIRTRITSTDPNRNAAFFVRRANEILPGILNSVITTVKNKAVRDVNRRFAAKQSAARKNNPRSARLRNRNEGNTFQHPATRRRPGRPPGAAPGRATGAGVRRRPRR